MKTHLIFHFCALALLLPSAITRAEDTSKPAPEQPKLAVVVVSNLHNERGAITAFDRLDLAFREIARKRKWPLAIEAERFAANTAPHETELRIFDQGLRNEVPGELKFRGWMTLTAQGAKHDFGIVTFTYTPRVYENREDALDKIYRGAAEAAADKIEPFLFPNRDDAKP